MPRKGNEPLDAVVRAVTMRRAGTVSGTGNVARVSTVNHRACSSNGAATVRYRACRFTSANRVNGAGTVCCRCTLSSRVIIRPACAASFTRGSSF